MMKIIESKNHTNTCINPLPKTNGAISQSSHTTHTPTSLSHTHTLIDRHTNPTNITSTHNTIATTHSSSNAMHHSHTTHTSHTNTHSPFIRSYSNTLTILPSSIAFTPSSKPKPLPPFSTQGIVIGQSTDIQAESNTIYTDEYGRVRVRIHCFANQEEIDNALYATHSYKEHNQSLDSHITSNPSSSRTHRDSPANASLRDSIANTPSSQTKDITRESHTTHSLHSKETNPQESIAKQPSQTHIYSYSPFLRVSTPIASNHSGLYHTPRVGDEVIISYMDNDIDKPYISGSLYNQHNPSLANLPTQDHITALSSKTIGVNEQGSNEITLSNEKDKEEITLKAQKDYTQSINHNFSQTIKNNKDSITLGNYTESIHKAHMQTITLAKNVNIGGEYLTNVTLSKDTLVGLSNSLNVGGDNTLRVAKDSSEHIGGDRRVEVGGNSREEIEGDKHTMIKGESQMYVEKSLTQSIQQEMLLDIQQNFSTNVKENLATNAKSMQNNVDEQYSLQADNATLELQSDCSIQAGNSLNFNIGQTTITATSDSVIIKAGGVEVIIDSKGLIVKGGEVKSE